MEGPITLKDFFRTITPEQKSDIFKILTQKQKTLVEEGLTRKEKEVKSHIITLEDNNTIEGGDILNQVNGDTYISGIKIKLGESLDYYGDNIRLHKIGDNYMLTHIDIMGKGSVEHIFDDSVMRIERKKSSFIDQLLELTYKNGETEQLILHGFKHQVNGKSEQGDGFLQKKRH